MSKRLRRMASALSKGGFTLPEVLVTVALIAVLAAVVVPTIVGQIKKGDPNRVAQDATDIRGAIEQFVSDVRKYPASIGQLTNVISTSMHPLQTGGTVPSNYTSADVARWKGPYLNKDSITVSTTGFGWAMQYAFMTDSFTTASSSTSNGVGAYYGATTNPNRFLVIRMCTSLSGVGCLASATTDSASWLLLDQQVDDGFVGSGSIRFRSDSGVKFLLMPIQP